MILRGNKIYIRASSKSKVMGGEIGLSETERIKLLHLINKKRGRVLHAKTNKPLAMTKSDNSDFDKLIKKRGNPQLPQTAKSYLDELVVSSITGHYPNMENKYTIHGNDSESISNDQISLLVKSLLKTKYNIDFDGYSTLTERMYDDDLMMTGEADVVPEMDYIIDYKNSFNVFTFDKSDSELIDNYEWQGQDYCYLYNKSVCYFIYTLNENQFMNGDEYENMKLIDRISIHKVVRDDSKINEYKKRLPLIKKYIDDKMSSMIANKKRTKELLLEIVDIESKRIA